MLGATVLAGLAAYLGICIFLVAKLRRRWAKVAAIAIAVGIPTWDIPIGYLYHRHLCESDGGIRVVQPFRPQEAIFFDSMPSHSANEILRKGFRTVEIGRIDGKGVARHQWGSNQQVVTKIVDGPESPIAVSTIRGANVGWNVVRDEQVARMRESNQVLARYTSYSWAGGWLNTLSPHPGWRVCSLGPSDPLVALLLRGS